MTNKPGFSGWLSRCNRRQSQDNKGCCDFLTDWIDNMIIPWQQLTAETLENLIETFVLREGTDYGEQERSLEQKVAEVRQQLKTGEAVLIWSELHETINIMPRTLFRG